MAVGLKGIVTLVTGASIGIGEATAKELAARGAAITPAARRSDRLTALAAQITAAGGTARVVEADLTEQDQAREAVDQTVQAWGRLDILINNAGVARLGPVADGSVADGSVADGSVADWERMVRINVLGSLYCAHAAVDGGAGRDGHRTFPPEVRRRHREEHGTYERLRSEDVADAIGYIVTRPRHVAVSELLVRPTEQER